MNDCPDICGEHYVYASREAALYSLMRLRSTCSHIIHEQEMDVFCRHYGETEKRVHDMSYDQTS